MSYLVLARKWRPRRFTELVGQEHVVRALTNALETGRVHHAFLFTGTRGVGKTTIARIFAKSLNCENGTSTEPCGECSTCKDIDAGRYIDLLEIDAASNTGVDDVRELIDNAQYMPSRGRVKVYLIDEVHMLTRNAFNALLKTLEEPPGHVKFLLATTDPQKLPVTVLSRCLQFNLKRLELDQIEGQMSRILQAEGIAFEPEAIAQLSDAADGSLRDGLSLLDQAIAYTGGKLEDAAVAKMLGTVDRTRVDTLLDALTEQDGQQLMAEIAALADFSPDWSAVLEAMAKTLHRIQVKQLVPEALVDDTSETLARFAKAIPPELVQLWYQFALNGKRDLENAPTMRTGFEMTLLRMLAFRPSQQQAVSASTSDTPSLKPQPRAEVPSASAPVAAPKAQKPHVAAPTPAPAPARPTSTPNNIVPMNHEDWAAMVRNANLSALIGQLAINAALLSQKGAQIVLGLPQAMQHMARPNTLRALEEKLTPILGYVPVISVELQEEVKGTTVRAQDEKVHNERLSAAEQAFRDDPFVSTLLAEGGQIVPDSIQPINE
jgi:DNA polymerase-3 subunit gamma/tau